MMDNPYRKDDDHIRELTPGIQTHAEKKMPSQVNTRELLKDEELWYRSINK